MNTIPPIDTASATQSLRTERLAGDVGTREAEALRQEALSLLDSTVRTFQETLPGVSFRLTASHSPALQNDESITEVVAEGLDRSIIVHGQDIDFHRRVAAILCSQLSANIRSLNNLARIRQAKREWEVSADLLEDEIYLVDLEWRIHRINRQAAATLGTLPPEQIGRRLATHGFGGDTVLRAALPAGDVQANQYMLPLDGRIYQIRIYSEQWGESRSGYILVRSDRTDDVAAQQAQVRSARLAGLGQVSLGLAHEINNPLGIILAAAGALERRYPQLPEIAGLAATISGEVSRCRRITHALLDYGRTPDRQASIQALDSVLEQLTERMRALSPRNRIRLRLQGTAHVHGNADDLERLFSNLLNNAFEAAGTEVILQLESDQEHAVVHVSNRGEPIPSMVVEHMFDPFYTTKEKGTGLGLAFAARIVELMHGSIRYSRKSPYNRFTVRIPLVRPS